jgi:predicted DNA repair protein MutK
MKRLAKGTTELEAVVVTVRVTGMFVAEGVKLTFAGLKLQTLSDGKFEHTDGKRLVEPVKPVCAANVKIVDPDCPGLATLTVIGLAVIVNAGPDVTISMEVEGEADAV